MSVAVCIARPENESVRAHWDHVRSNFGLNELYLIGDDLPDQPLVVVQPLTGVHVQGECPLQSFVHPSHVTYLFGPDEGQLLDDFPVVPRFIYIPTFSRRDMFSFVACAVVMWDRKIKL